MNIWFFFFIYIKTIFRRPVPLLSLPWINPSDKPKTRSSKAKLSSNGKLQIQCWSLSFYWWWRTKISVPVNSYSKKSKVLMHSSICACIGKPASQWLWKISCVATREYSFYCSINNRYIISESCLALSIIYIITLLNLSSLKTCLIILSSTSVLINWKVSEPQGTWDIRFLSVLCIYRSSW